MIAVAARPPATPSGRTQASDQGAATVEMALLAPLLVALLLLVVLCGRLVSVQLDLDAAAHAAARTASLTRTVPEAITQAHATAAAILDRRHAVCRRPDVHLDTGGLQAGGMVTATISCTVPLADLVLLGVPGTRTVTATATSPIDQWRGVALDQHSTGAWQEIR